LPFLNLSARVLKLKVRSSTDIGIAVVLLHSSTQKIATYRSLVVSGTGAGIYEGTNFRSIGPRANKFAINIFCFWSKQAGRRFNRDVEGGHSL
jgi:hypothetical protein